MVELCKEEIQKIRLDVADAIKDFCNEYGLTCYLSGSTLLGAIRHRGFIPWNNTMSMMLKREDYDLLVRIFNEKSIEKKSSLRLFTYADDDEYGFAYGKVTDTNTLLVQDGGEGDGLGVGVKVFPIDGAGKTRSQGEKTVKKAGYYHDLLRLKAHKTHTQKFYSAGKLKRILQKLRSKFITRQGIIKKIEALLRKEKFDDSIYAGVIISNFKTKAIVDKELFSSTITVPFEDREYTVIEQYDKYLNAIFGDYMSLPCEKERKARDVKVYKKELK